MWLDLPTEDKVSCLPNRIKLYLLYLSFKFLLNF